MNTTVQDGKSKRKWIWTIGLVLLAIAISFWFARPLGEPAKVEPGKPQAQSTEWAPDADEKAVPVNLPTTPLKDVAEEPRKEVDEAAGEKE